MSFSLNFFFAHSSFKNEEEAKTKSDGGRVLPLSLSWSKNHYTRKYVTFQHHVSRSSWLTTEAWKVTSNVELVILNNIWSNPVLWRKQFITYSEDKFVYKAFKLQWLWACSRKMHGQKGSSQQISLSKWQTLNAAIKMDNKYRCNKYSHLIVK